MNSIQMKRSGDLAFENAKHLLSALESVVESELAKKNDFGRERKKGSPLVIVPISSKSRSLDAFTRIEQQTIINNNNKKKGSLGSPLSMSPSWLKKSQGTPKALGRVIWDSKDSKWIESKRSPGLIRRFDSSTSLLHKLKQGDMVYDPATRTWHGNDAILDDFDDDDDGDFASSDVEFQVGNEFNLTPEMKKQFAKAEHNHKTTTQGWWSSSVRMDLFAIRSMAMTRIVHDAKNSRNQTNNPSSFSSTSTSSSTRSRSNSPSNPICSEEQAWENEVGPWKGTIKLRLPKESDVLSLDFIDDEPQTQEQEPQTHPINLDLPSCLLGGDNNDYDVDIDDDDDDWDADFDDISITKIQNKASLQKGFIHL